MQFIDSHVHIGVDRDGISASKSDVEQLIDRGWIDKAVVFCLDEVDGIKTGNANIQQAVQNDDRFAGLFRVDPRIHTPDDLRKTDLAGFKMHPRSQDFSMQTVYQHLDVIGELDKPVLIHTGGWSKRAHPEEIIEAAENHPNTTFIAAHNTKGYYYQTSEEWRQRFIDADNLHMETSLNCTPKGIETLVAEIGAERVVYGTDFPYGHPVPMNKNIEYADIPDEAKEKITWQNAERLFFQ